MYQDFAKDVRLAAAPDTVWTAILDVQRVASWLPIVKDVREREPLLRYDAVLEDRVGPFALRADLEVTVQADAAAHRLTVSAAGEDRQIASRITASVDLGVSSDGSGSQLAVTGRYEITGKIATFGAGAIRKKGEKVLDEFFANLAGDLAPAG